MDSCQDSSANVCVAESLLKWFSLRTINKSMKILLDLIGVFLFVAPRVLEFAIPILLTVIAALVFILVVVC